MMETALWIALLTAMIVAPIAAVYLQVKAMGEPPDAGSGASDA